MPIFSRYARAVFLEVQDIVEGFSVSAVRVLDVSPNEQTKNESANERMNMGAALFGRRSL